MEDNKPLFAGSIPEAYHRYLVPLLFEDYAQDLVSRIQVPPDGAVLETACGTGVVTRHLRMRLPKTVRLIATDLNPPMLEVAEAQLAGLDGIEYQTANGTALPFGDGMFDAVVCQFGIMFFPDKGQGYKEAIRVLKPGGAFFFNVWDSLPHNGFAECAHRAVVTKFPDNPPTFLSTPFGYHNLSEITTQLQGAGFAEIHLFVLPRESQAASAREVALAYATGTPLAAQLVERGIQAAAVEEIEAALVSAFGSGRVSAPMQAITIVAYAPQRK